MALRSWLIRGTIIAVLAALAVGAWIASDWISPEAIRTKVIAHLMDRFQGVDIQVESARLRIFGGIAVSQLRITRHGDSQPFLVVPAAVLMHDKEQLNRGRLVIRKIELDQAELNIQRNSQGEWNLAGVLRPTDPSRPIPTLVARSARVNVFDASPDGLPSLSLNATQFTILNDPLPMLNVEGQCVANLLGPVVVRGRFNRLTHQLSLGVDLPDIRVKEVTSLAVARYRPEMEEMLAHLSARLSVSADVTYTPDEPAAWQYDVRVSVKDGAFQHESLPWPLEKLDGVARWVNGVVRVEKATAQLGPIGLELSLETRTPEPAVEITHVSHSTGAGPGEGSCPSSWFLQPVEDYLRSLKLTARGVPLDEAFCDRLPGETPRRIWRMFQPQGAIDVSYEFHREISGWKRETEIRPKNLGFLYEKFRYPVADVRGWVRRTVTSQGQDSTLLKLHGLAGGQPITIEGQVFGDDDDPAVNLRIAGTNVPIDDTFISALPGRYPEIVRQFHLEGRGDFVAEIRQPLGVNLLENTFTIDLRDAKVNYQQFPYPLEKVKGRVIVRTTATDPERPLRPGEKIIKLPDRDELVLQDFSGRHGGGTIQLHGSKQPIPHTRDKKLLLHISGSDCPVDADLRGALAAIKLDTVWRSFSPQGRMTFAADVEILDRGPLVRLPPPLPVNPVSAPGNPGAAHESVVNAAVASTAEASKPAEGPADSEGPPFDPISDLKLTLNFYGPSITPEFFPYTVTDLAGWLEYRAGKVELGQLKGRHGDSHLKLNAGDIRLYPDGVVWANLGGLEFKPLVTDDDLLAALPKRLRSGIEELKLKGSTELTVKHLVVLTPPDKPSGPTPPGPLPLPLGVTEGSLKGEGAAQGPSSTAQEEKRESSADPPLAKFRGQAPVVKPAATAPAPPDPPDPIIYWDAELRLLDASLEVGVPWDEVIGAIAMRGRYEGTHMGQIRGNMWFDQLTIAKQPVTRAKVSFTAPAQAPDPMRPGQYLPTRLEFHDLSGTLFHGSVGGEARVILDETPRYELWLTAADVQLEEIARHYQLGSDADLKGIAQARVWLANRPDPKTGQLTVVGEGTVDVPSGRMYNLPVLLDLVKVLKLQAPDKTAFEEAHASFTLQGDRIKVEQLDLIGVAVCLGGSGELDTRGEYVRFEFYTIWSQMLKRWLTTPVGDLTAFFSKSLFKIKMTRKDGVLTYDGEVVPIVTEPVKAMLERIRRHGGRLLR